MSLQHLRQRDQAIVSVAVPVVIVHALEKIDIDHEQRNRLSLARTPPPRELQRRLEMTAIGYLRERIFQRHLAQRRVCLLQFVLVLQQTLPAGEIVPLHHYGLHSLDRQEQEDRTQAKKPVLRGDRSRQHKAWAK